MPLRASLDVSWDMFLRDWCLGVAPGSSRDDVRTALETLERLWPSRLDALEAAQTRGIAVVIDLVHDGLTLHAVEAAYGVEGVLDRLRSGERAAQSELAAGAGLSRLGVSVTFGAPLNGKVLDLSFPFGNRQHFVEVLEPERSDAIRDAQRRIADLTQAVSRANPGYAIDLVVLTPSANLDVLAAAVAAAPDASAVQQTDEAFFVKRGIGDTSPHPAIPIVAGSALVNVHGAVVEGRQTSQVTARLATADERARRLLDAERHHFSQHMPNILIMNVNQVVSTPDHWEALVARCFQPAQNTRISAVVLHSVRLFAGANRMWQRWRVMVNPHATTALSSELITLLRSLDDGDYIPPLPKPSGAAT